MKALLTHCLNLLPERDPVAPAWRGALLRGALLLAAAAGVLPRPAQAQPKPNWDIPAPNAASLGEYGQVPVNFFNGLPSIGVPLYTFKYRDLAVPIALNYHAGGNRPENYPGWVGLGWNLDAGGAVTRIVNGRPDEITAYDMNAQKGPGYQYPTTREYGYFFRSNEFDRPDWASQASVADFLNSAPNNWLSAELGPFDGEPDEFLFNAGDLSGSFFLYRDAGSTLRVKVKSKSGEYLKVEPTLSTAPVDLSVFNEIRIRKPQVHMRRTFTGFAVTRADGTKYTFGGNWNATDLNTTPGSTDGVVTLATSWFLTRIESPKGDAVTLEYKKQGDVFLKNTARTRSFLYIVGNNNCACGDVQRSYTLQHPSYLSRITAPDGSEVEFLSDRAAQLQYDFTSIPRDHEAQFAPLSPGGRWDANLLTYNYLLKLNQIKVKGVRTIAFTYTNSATQRLRLGSVEVTNPTDAASFKYRFAYNPLLLPDYNSKQTDNWGYYNGRNYENFTNTNAANTFDQLYAYRTPDATRMKAELLESITYPTGGQSVFEFEPHDYAKVAQQYPFALVNQAGTAGGVRIRRITSRTAAADPNPQVWEYFYQQPNNTSSGVLSGIPTYKAEGTQYIDFHFSQWSGLVYFSGTDQFRQNYLILAENSQNPLSNTNGNHVTYSRVVEKRSGQGQTVYRYTNLDTQVGGAYPYADLGPEGVVGNIDGKMTSNPFTSKELERGLLLSTEVYDEGNRLVQQVDNQYNDDPNRYNDYVKSLNALVIFGLPYPFARASANRIYTFYPYLKQRTETTYGRGTAPVAATTTYAYNTYRLLTEKSTTDSHGNSVRTTYRYVTDLSYSGPNPYVPTTQGLLLSVSRNLIATPVETVHYRNGAIVGGTVVLPALTTAAAIVPYQVYELETAQPLAAAQYTNLFFPAGSSNFIPPAFDQKYKLRQTFAYDARSNVQSITAADQAPTSYLWDYGQTLPVATAQNAAPNQVAYAGFEADPPGQFVGNAYVTFNANNWDYDPRAGLSTHRQPTGGFTGRGCYRLDGGWSIGRGNVPAGDYEVSFWATGGKANIYLWGGQVLSQSEGPANATAQDYRLVRFRVRLAAPGTIAFDAYGRQVDVDDVRLYPVGAQMTTYTHTPNVGVTSTSDVNNQPTQYDYDGLQRLRLVKDNRGNVVKHLQYHYQH